MDPDEFRAILAAAKIDTEPASPEFLDWLATAVEKCPEDLVALFRGCMPKMGRHRQIADRWELFTGEEIREANEEYPRYLEAGFLAVGGGPSGDPIAVDLHKRGAGQVGYISHDEVWEDDEAKVGDFFARVAPDLLEFARRASRGEVPIDYYAAIEGR